jgi:GNAT superfamily N-acetyltransferase
MVEYRSATAEDVPAIRFLFSEYAESLGIDLSFQDFHHELATLPGKYAPPDGTVILASHRGVPCGCVALRKIDRLTCEMKRLYVRPEKRGLRIGRELVRRILEDALARGYSAMRLDTLRTMESAVSLYRSFGFREIAPYIFNPIPGALYMERSLLLPITDPPPS